MKILLAFILFFISIPQNDSEKIKWKENQKLTWNDFRGKPVRSASFVASTNTGIAFQYSYSNTNGKIDVNYSVESFFNPDGSWYLPERVSPYILAHEQAHFDISELHARILRKNLEGKKFSKKVKSEIESIYQKVEQQRRAMQTKFDAETDHSRNEKKEIEWENYIAKKLAEHNAWK
jgi:hypothetical protein